MKTLHLNLKRKWFDMILSGEKKEEYRVISSYWLNRIGKPLEPIDKYQFKEFDSITFSNGYAKDRNQFKAELLDIKIGTGKQEWGAEKHKQYFVLVLGEISYT